MFGNRKTRKTPVTDAGLRKFDHMPPAAPLIFDRGGWVPLGVVSADGFGFDGEDYSEPIRTTRIVTHSFRFQTTASVTRMIYGLSRKEYRIERGLERKQLLHKGGKP